MFGGAFLKARSVTPPNLDRLDLERRAGAAVEFAQACFNSL